MTTRRVTGDRDRIEFNVPDGTLFGVCEIETLRRRPDRESGLERIMRTQFRVLFPDGRAIGAWMSYGSGPRQITVVLTDEEIAKTRWGSMAPPWDVSKGAV